MSAWTGLQPRRGRRAIWGTLLAPLVILAMSGTGHAAEVSNHPFIKTLLSGLVEEPKPVHPVLDAPCGVAVEPGGGILVTDYYRKSIFSTTLPENISPLPDYYPNDGPCALASDGENVYVNYWHGGVVNRDFGVIDPGPATGIAVDPGSGDLYVNHRTSIAVYEAPVHSGEIPLEVGAGSLVDGFGVAVSDFAATAGDIYVGDAAGNTIKVFHPPAVNPVLTIDGAGTPQGGFVSLRDTSLVVEQATGRLLVVDDIKPGAEHPLAAIDEFNAEGLYRGQLEHEIVDGEPTGIAADESVTGTYGQIYVTSGNGNMTSGSSGTTAVTTPENSRLEAEAGRLFVFGLAGAGEKLAVSRSGPGTGSIGSDPAGIACPGSCEAELNSGAKVALTATPASGSAFAGWSGGGCSGAAACQVTLAAATAVNAEFTLAPALHAPSTQTHAAGPPPPGRSLVNLSLGRASAVGTGAALLRAMAPGPGTLTVSAKGVRRTRLRLSHSGPLTLRVCLDRAGMRRLAKSPTGHLALQLSVAFEPSQGPATGPLKKSVTFK